MRTGRATRVRVRRALHGAGLLRQSRSLRTLTRLTQRLPTQGNDIAVFHEADTLYDRMLADIAAAQVRISVEMYMFQSDSIGLRFVRALCERARAGIRVLFIYDAVGSFSTPASLFREMSDAGVVLHEYHPVALWRRSFALFGRNHRKTLVVDGRIAYTGGVNIGLQWASVENGGSGWRDTHARLEGPAAGDLEALLEETWFTETGQLLNLPRTVPREPEQDHHDHDQVFVIAGRGTSRRHIRRYYLAAIHRAVRTINITSAYFIPDRGLRRALHQARQRGIRVRLLLPGQSDVALTLWACRAFLGGLLRKGIEIWLWQPSVLHAKSAIVDGEWATIGTSNLDQLSFHYNLEANLAILGAETAPRLEQQFELDLRSSKQLTLDEWKQRPLLDRVKELLARLVRAWL